MVDRIPPDGIQTPPDGTQSPPDGILNHGGPIPGAKSVTRIDGMPGGRHYQVEGIDELFPSVTNVLGVINKPALAPWARNAALESVQTALLARAGMTESITTQWVANVIDQARQTPDSKRDQAAGFGTQAHELIDHIIQGLEPEVPPELEAVVNNFLAWRASSGMDIRLTEAMVYSEKYRYAGSADAIAYRDGKLIVLDWKTGNGIYPEYGLQVAAYAKALEEMTGEPVGEAWTVRLGRIAPDFESQRVVDLDRAFISFRAALYLWRAFQGNLMQPAR